MKKHNIIALSYAKQMLEQGSREYARLKQYSEELDSFHVIVFTKKSDQLRDSIEDGALFVHATNTRTKLGAVLRAYAIGRKIVARSKNTTWIISCQDPFETSVVGLLLSYRTHAKLHVQVHGDNFRNEFWRASRCCNSLRLLFGRYVLKKAAGVRVVGARIKRALKQEGIAADTITVLPIQPDLEPFLLVGANREVRHDPTCTFLYVGRFAPEKNIPMLIAAFSAVYQQNNTVRLRLVGRGTEEAKIQQQIDSLGLREVVSLVPWTESVASEMERADSFVLSSDHEGYGLVLVEAMAAGLPVVSTDVGCVGEVVLPEKHGYVSTPRDTDAYAASLQRMARMGSEARYTMGQQNHLAAKETALSQEAYTKRWIDSYTI